MIDPDDWEVMALEAALPVVGELLGEIGWQTRFCDLSKEMMVTMLMVAIGAYHDKIAELARGRQHA